MNQFSKSFMAGIMITIGATVKLSTADPIVGNLLFSIALLYICLFGMNLFTGKAGYLGCEVEWKDLINVWFGNLCGCAATGTMIRIMKPELHEKALLLMTTKLETNTMAACVAATMCGVLMFLAVDNYKKHVGWGEVYGLAGIIFSVVVFMTCGFEHSIANMAYATLAVDSIVSGLLYLFYIVMVSGWNVFGAMFTRGMIIGE